MNAPPLLIATRFGLGIRDAAWFRHRLDLLSAVTAPSLLAQEDQRFEWVLFVDSGLPNGIREELEHLLAGFSGRATVETGGYHSANLLRIATERGLVGVGGRALMGRIDDDDAWARSTVGLVRKRAASWLDLCGDSVGFGMTFVDGLVWIMYDMFDVEHFQDTGEKVTRQTTIRRFPYAFTSISGFVLADVSYGLSPLSASHARVGDVLERNGLSVERCRTDEPMWLYCRHKQATSGLLRARKDDEVRMTLEELGQRFGIDVDRTTQYLSAADGHAYGLAKRTFSERARHRRRLIELDQCIAELEADSSEEAQLAAVRRERAKVERELTGLSDHVVGDPELDRRPGRPA